MANVVTPLKTWNTINLTAGNAYHLTAPPGHYYFQILNSGSVAAYISDASTVSSSDPASYELPANLAVSPLVWGPTGVWLSGAGAVSVQLVGKQ